MSCRLQRVPPDQSAAQYRAECAALLAKAEATSDRRMRNALLATAHHYERLAARGTAPHLSGPAGSNVPGSGI